MKVFTDRNGNLYKAEVAKFYGDQENVGYPDKLLDVLTDEPQDLLVVKDLLAAASRVVALLVIGLFSIFLVSSRAQATTSYPIYQLTTTTNSGSITSGGTYQQIWASGGRNGCLIQNNGSFTQWVYFGAIANATHANSYAIQPGQGISCNIPGGVLTDQVSIDGTTADTFAATLQ